MRKPNQRRLWRINPTTGLCDFLAKIQDLSIYDVDGIPLSIVCTGTIPPNPSELLSSESMKNFVEECSNLYEYIIIDTPPINTVADAQIVSTFVDGVVLIAKAENISLPSDKLNIVTVARFGKEKGVLRAIRAVSKLEKKDLLKYYIIGDGTEFEQAKALIDELKLSENVTLLGEKENPYGYIKAADLLLIPSYSEAAPMVIGEGFSSVIIGKRASHNTIIQGVFQFGIIGFPFLIAWFVITIKNLISNISDKKPHFLYILLMGVGIVLPWMALDIIFFDELFLLPVYGALAVAYSSIELERGK